MSWVDYQKAMQNFVVRATGLSADKVVWGQQQSARPAAPAIIMRLSNIAEIGQSELNIEDKPFTFTAKTVTLVDVAGNAFTIPNHGLLTGDGPVLLDSNVDNVPAPFVELKNYWTIVLDANRIQLTDTYEKTGGGQGAGNPITPVVLTSAGSGAITVNATGSTVRAGQEIEAVARVFLRVTLELRCHSADGVGEDMATSILQRVRTRRLWPSVKQILQDANIAVIDVDRVRAIQGIQDAVLFEPRAYLDVHFCVAVQESEVSTIISSVELTNQTTGRVFTVP